MFTPQTLDYVTLGRRGTIDSRSQRQDRSFSMFTPQTLDYVTLGRRGDRRTSDTRNILVVRLFGKRRKRNDRKHSVGIGRSNLI